MKKSNIPREIQLRVWIRDAWTCRYCNEPVFFAPTLKLLNQLSPEHGYYHPNGKSGVILPLFQWRWCSVDHVHPSSKGGEDKEENYVTACWECNLKFNDKTIEKGKPSPKSINVDNLKIKWDGFSSIYVKLSKKKDGWVRLLEKCGEHDSNPLKK
ncbi:MAG TPA: HNH endonuclease [Candidatus Nanoarchaeia archaeon]|nr:HNH endonuclease [Candidatus Nanoarchaeia archaeon]